MVFVIFLILILAGCEPHFLDGDDDYTQVEDLVYNYWIAMINRQYELAKYSCVPGGIWYNKTDEWEEYINVNSEGGASVLIYFGKFYEPTEVAGDTAVVYTEIITHKIPFPGSSEIIGIGLAEIDNDYEMELIMETPFEGWKLK